MGSNFIKFNIASISFNLARILMVVIGILFLLDIIISIVNKQNNSIHLKNKSIKYCIIFFIIWSIYSLFSFYKSHDIKTYFIMNFFICIGTLDILFFCRYVKIKEKKNVIFNIINIAIFINCIYYIFLYFIRNENIGGFYHNSNDLATVIILAIPMSIFMIIESKNIAVKILNTIFLCTYIYSFINILSRACLLGVFFAIFIFIVFTLIKYRNKIFKNILFDIAFTILLIISIMVITHFYEHYIGKLNFTPIENAESSNQVRTNLILNGIYFLSQGNNFVLGIGAGNNSYFLEHNSIYSTHNIYNFHNFWLDLLVEYGVIIFALFIITYFIICKSLYKNIIKKSLKTIDTIYLFFLIAFIIASISSSTIITREWLWIAFAMILTYINEEKEKEIKK